MHDSRLARSRFLTGVFCVTIVGLPSNPAENRAVAAPLAITVAALNQTAGEPPIDQPDEETPDKTPDTIPDKETKANTYPDEPTDCQACHATGPHGDASFAPQKMLTTSVHESLDCTDCHQSISMDDLDLESDHPHGATVPPVACGDCHEDEDEAYTKHGRLRRGTDPDIPKCQDCHGAHDILPADNHRSRLHPANLANTCRKCHANVDLVKKHDVLRERPIEQYSRSVHGRSTRKGIYVAATCNDCHSAKENGKRTAHRILGPADPESSIFHFNIPDTCGQCHESITRDYWEGIHGHRVKQGSVDSPVCTTCHGEHGILPPGDPDSPVSAAHVAEQTCSPCHDSAVLNEKYGLPGGRLASYVDSYHGLKSKAGDVTVANCASCHGAHRILPSTDPASSIYPSNLRTTCGECHPGITEELAQTPIHATGAGLHAGWAEFFRDLYIVLIIATVGGMLLHNLAEWMRETKRRMAEAYVQRLSYNEVLQHWVLLVSFTVLVISGFSLRFSESWWVRLLFGWKGGFEARGDIHRVAGVVLIVGSIWHLLYLFTHRGRHWLKDMIASKADLRDFWHNIGYFLGRRKNPPAFGRFSYMEKIEYWALVWGTVIMSFTGLLLWFDTLANRYVPKGFLDVMLVIHYYEAWLATLAILIWHIYGTVFRPGTYPMNPAWLAGRMPKAQYDHEHPEGPRLKARIQVPRYEEELEDNGSAADTRKGHTGPVKGS